MALQDSTYSKKNNGFTIVELLIVIVVIAILATISIVAYGNIQTRAKTNAAQANSASVQKTAEAYFAENSAYPTTVAHFSASSAKAPANLIISSNDPDGGTGGEREVEYHYTPASGTATGARIRYWDFGTGAISSNILYLGNATSGSTYNTAAL